MRTLWISLGVGGVLLVLCCVGGLVGGRFLYTGLEGVARSQMASVTEDYLTTLRDRDYAAARDLLCPEEQRLRSLEWYQEHYRGTEITEFTVHEDDINTALLQVPATVTRTGRPELRMRFTMKQQSTQWVICGGVD